MIDVYLEIGPKRVMAVAREWPGWCRRGNDEAGALAALLEAASRYGQIVQGAGLSFEPPQGLAGLSFEPPQGLAGLHATERVAGSVATEMGIPEVVLAGDAAPMSEPEQARAAQILQACWDAFERALARAQGQPLRKGPRGGGRDLEAIARHVAGAEASYAARVGLKSRFDEIDKLPDIRQALAVSHEQVLAGLAAVATTGVPPPGPRGGARWPARYFVRRVAYHVVDHTWEIEDRLAPPD